MAIAQEINLSNYSTLLVQSTQGRAGTPTGNVYFDVENGLLEFIPKEELAQVDLGSGLEDNPLAQQEGIKLEAAYAFENLRRKLDENLREFDKMLKGNFKFAGAYKFVANNKPSTDADRAIIRGSGWEEQDASGAIGRIFYGNIGLSNIEVASQPYNQFVLGGAPTNYAKVGNFNEAVQVYGDAAVDAGTTTFDNRTYEAVSVRTFGLTFDRKETTTDLGILETGGYATGFAVNEGPHLTTGNYLLADVYGGAQVSPWTGMTLEKLATPQTESGFAEADGDFTWVLNNTENGTLDQCVAFLDALAQTDDDIDSGSETVTNGQRVNEWYSYNGAGQVVTQSGADSLGLFIENVPVSDEQRIVFTADDTATKTRPFSVELVGDTGALAPTDVEAWYHMFGLDDFNTVSAITVLNAGGSAIKGNVADDHINNKIVNAFDYDGDTVLGDAATDKDCVFLVEGDGTVTQAKTVFTITRQTTVAFAAIPATENNV